MLWVMMFVNISGGIMVISVASPLAPEKVGPMAVAYIRDTTGPYDAAFYAFGALLAVTRITSLLMIANMRQVRREEPVLAGTTTQPVAS